MNKKNLINLSICLAVIGLVVYLFIHIHIRNTTVVGECIGKHITWDKHGESEYHIAYRLEDGTIQVRWYQDGGSYYNINIGDRRQWNVQDFYWK